MKLIIVDSFFLVLIEKVNENKLIAYNVLHWAPFKDLQIEK